MGFTYEVLSRNLIVNIAKDLDHHNAEIVREKIDRLVMRDNIKYIIFNFKNVEFMDSSGIGVIMGRYKMINNIGGDIVVSNVNERVDRIFKLSGLYKIIKKYDDVDSALGSFK